MLLDLMKAFHIILEMPTFVTECFADVAYQ